MNHDTPSLHQTSHAPPCTQTSHRWRIEEANGPTSAAHCRNCGLKRDFHNWLPEADVTTRTEHELAA